MTRRVEKFVRGRQVGPDQTPEHINWLLTREVEPSLRNTYERLNALFTDEEDLDALEKGVLNIAQLGLHQKDHGDVPVAVTLDITKAVMHTVTLTGPAQITLKVPNQCIFWLLITQNGIGSHVPTFAYVGGALQARSGSSMNVSMLPGRRTIVEGWRIGTDVFLGSYTHPQTLVVQAVP